MGLQSSPHQYLSAQRGGAVDGVGIVGHHAAQGGAGHGHRHADLRLTAAGSTGDAGPIGDDGADTAGYIQCLQNLALV